MAQRFTVEADTVALWHFEETTGNYLDETANNNDSTAIQVTSRTATGKWGYCPEFDGTNDYVRTGGSASLQVNSGTLEFWMKANVSPEDGDRIANIGITSADNVTNRLDTMINSGGSLAIWFVINNTNTYQLSSAAGYNDTNWHHIAITWDVNGAALYIDGSVVDSEVGDRTLSLPADSTVLIGAWVDANYAYGGLIDEVRISNTAHTATKILRDYKGTVPPAIIFQDPAIV